MWPNAWPITRARSAISSPTATSPRALEDELGCQGAQASVLMSTENVTRSRRQSHRRRRTSGGHRRSQQGADDARSRLRAGVEAGRHAAGLRIRHAVSRGTVPGSTSTSATTMCAWHLRRSRRSALSAATRTISSSLAGVSTCRCCACTRTANRHRRRTISTLSGRAPRKVNRCSSPAIRAPRSVC